MQALSVTEGAVWGGGLHAADTRAKMFVSLLASVATVALSGVELGMHKGAKAGVAHIPHAATPVWKFHGLSRTKLVAHAAALAGQLVNAVHAVHKVYGVKTAQLGAPATGGTELRIDAGRVARYENLALLHLRV